jgi:hypothetical protein
LTKENGHNIVPEWFWDMLKVLSQNPETTGLAISLGAIVTGAVLMLDDYKDFGKDGSERRPAMPHHWLWGVLTLIGGVAGTCASGIALLKKTLSLSDRVQKSFNINTKTHLY